MKRILAMAMALGVVLGAGAAAPETVTLKNGSVYMGRTSVKNFEKRSSTFMADSAVVVDSVKNVSLTMTVMPLASVKDGLANWFRQHPERIGIGRDGAEEVVVHRLRNASSSVTDDVVLLERGPKVVKYVIIAPLTEEIPDSNVVSYDYAPREPQAISGIIDEVVTTDGRTLEGQIVHEGSLFGILTADNMVVEMLPYSKLSSTSKRALYADQPIIEQVPVLDEVRTKDGRTVSGIITSVNRRPHDGKPYYMLRPVNHGSEVKLYFDDVTAIYQPYNRDYKPLKDTRIDAETTIIVAGTELAATPYTMKQGSADLLFSLDKLPEPVKAIDGGFKLEMRNVTNNQQIMLVPLEMPKPGKDGKYEISCSAQSILLNSKPGLATLSPYGNRNIAYTVAPGLYLVYRNADKKAYLINLVK